MDAGVVELDALADAVRAAAEDHDLLVGGDFDLIRDGLVGRVVVAGVLDAADRDLAVGGGHAELDAAFADHAFAHGEELGEVLVGEAVALGGDQHVVREGHEAEFLEFAFELGELGHLLDEILRDAGHREDFVHGAAAAQEFVDHEEALAVRGADLLAELVHGEGGELGVEARAAAADLKRADGLLEGFLEVLADGHDFADGLHLGSEGVLRLRELLERPAGELHDHVVSARRVFLERAVAPVRDLVERDAGGEERGDVGDGEAGGLRGQGGRTRGAGIDLDDDDAAVLAVVRELDVGAAGHADGVDDAVGVVLELFLDFLGDGEHGGHAEAVAGVDAHRVDVFDEADGDLLALFVADDFELELFPAEHALLDEDFVDQAGGETARHDLTEFFHVVHDAAAGAAHGVGGTEHDGIADAGGDGFAFLDGVGGSGFGDGDAELGHGLLELDAVFAALDGVEVDADDLHAVLGEHAGFGEAGGEVQSGLAAEVRQEGVRMFALNDAFHALDGKRFDVSMIGHAGIGHDRGRIRVDEDDLVARAAQGLARLRAGIVEFTGLSDDDRSGTDDQDLLDVLPLRHGGISVF